MLLHSACEERDVSVATGALNMARTLGGCVAIAVCSALHHSVLRSKLPAFLTSAQIKAVEETSAYIAKMPADVKEEIGRVFGRSYNRQFEVMLGFACLNVLVAVALALVRKKKGIYGVMPVRTVENEFMKKVEEQSDNRNDKEVAPALDASQGKPKDARVDGISRIRSQRSQEGDMELKRLSKFTELDV
jgi:hypothetical protein